MRLARTPRSHPLAAALASIVLALTPAATAAELQPIAAAGLDAERPVRFSDRTLSLLVQVDRDQARLLAFTRKERPFIRAQAAPAPRAYRPGEKVQIEAVLLGPGGVTLTERVDVGPLCLDHPADTPPHIEGDDILVHRDTFVLEVPEVQGFDQVEIAWYDGDAAAPLRRGVGFDVLDPARFTAAGSGVKYGELAIAAAAPGSEGSLATSGAVHWPEEYGDPDVYTVYGNEGETGRRINLVIVPDGYTHSQKALMQTHAQALVNAFRQKTPYKEHDAFFNYVLVYAYSTESGTDQCDCSIVKDTAMNTRFPQLGSPPYACGDSRNRCLYYGTVNGGPDCDQTTSEANIGLAELRAPADDQTVVMVNTSRYGGCGGARAVYGAGDSSATEIAMHELGHSLAGLNDEYGGNGGCGSYDGINVSTDGVDGNWPEWRADLGAPPQGARFYNQCIYRPTSNCDMRSLGVPFCPVCNQRWSLVYFGHSRIRPTAPVEALVPPSPATTEVGLSTDFSPVTRLASGAAITNSFTWQIQGPGYPTPTTVATGSPAYSHTFVQTGTYTLTCAVVADTNFVKAVKNDGNVDTATWTVNVGPSTCDAAPAFAGLDTAADVDACAASGVRLIWPAATFGPDGGSYDIWRDGARIQRGVTGSPWVDVPGDAYAHTYRVHAVTADCGLEENNAVDRSAGDRAGDPAPGFTGISLAADAEACAVTGVTLGWPAATFGASGGVYDVYRDGAAVALGLTATATVDLPGDSLAHTYRIAARSSDCGAETAPPVTLAAADGSGDAAPVFAGLQAVVDLDPCLPSGVQLSWGAAVFGPAGGVYRVWKDGSLAATVAASPYLDLPGDASPHVYAVTALGACDRWDGNAVTLAAADVFVDPAAVPATLGNTLTARRSGASVALAWQASAGARTYNLYRASGKDSWPIAPDLSGLTAASGSLPDVGALPALLFYRASASNCLGREGP